MTNKTSWYISKRNGQASRPKLLTLTRSSGIYLLSSRVLSSHFTGCLLIQSSLEVLDADSARTYFFYRREKGKKLMLNRVQFWNLWSHYHASAGPTLTCFARARRQFVNGSEHRLRFLEQISLDALTSSWISAFLDQQNSGYLVCKSVLKFSYWC